MPTNTSRMLMVVAAAWILSMGFDFLLHGGLLASLYVEPHPFLLPPAESFRRIPLGYLAFLGLTVSLYWMLGRLGIRGWATGFRYGAAAGAVVWGAMVIGLYSISTAEPALLGGWWLGQAIELGLAGAVIGAAANGVASRRLWTIGAVSGGLKLPHLLDLHLVQPTHRLHRLRTRCIGPSLRDEWQLVHLLCSSVDHTSTEQPNSVRFRARDGAKNQVISPSVTHSASIYIHSKHSIAPTDAGTLGSSYASRDRA